MILLSSMGDLPLGMRCVAIFGAGTIGLSIRDAILLTGPWTERTFALDWWKEDVQASQLGQIEDYLAGVLNSTNTFSAASEIHLEIIWSAGGAGFFADKQATAGELASFRAVLVMAERLAEVCDREQVSFHLVSSAGGMYEGQHLVTQQTKVAPRRPYGELKFRQEDLLASASPLLMKRIYRPASVYASTNCGHRRGLIPTLVFNTCQNRCTTIFGQPTTLRDFVSAEDIGQYMARWSVADRERAVPVVSILASAKPTLIHEVKKTIEDTLLRPVLVRYAREAWNSEDITFSPSALPPAWRPADLVTNIRRICCMAIEAGNRH